MDVAELIEELGAIKTASNTVYKTYKELKETEDKLKVELFAKLHDTGLKSAKGNTYTASIAEKPGVIVTHEKSVLDWLKESPDVEADAYIGLKVTPFKTFALQVMKTTGEVIPGTELQTTESLSIRANKKG